jgi:hypothetical protein
MADAASPLWQMAGAGEGGLVGTVPPIGPGCIAGPTASLARSLRTRLVWLGIVARRPTREPVGQIWLKPRHPVLKENLLAHRAHRAGVGCFCDLLHEPAFEIAGGRIGLSRTLQKLALDRETKPVRRLISFASSGLAIGSLKCLEQVPAEETRRQIDTFAGNRHYHHLRQPARCGADSTLTTRSQPGALGRS